MGISGVQTVHVAKKNQQISVDRVRQHC